MGIFGRMAGAWIDKMSEMINLKSDAELIVDNYRIEGVMHFSSSADPLLKTEKPPLALRLRVTFSRPRLDAPRPKTEIREARISNKLALSRRRR